MNMGVKQIFTRSCVKTNAECAGKFVSHGLGDLMSKDDKTRVVKHECKINLNTIMYLYKCRKPGKFVSPGQDDLVSTEDKTSG